jgi:hypothetical protein
VTRGERNVIDLRATGASRQAVADVFGLTIYQVDHILHKYNAQKKTGKKHLQVPTELELIRKYDYLGFEATERDTVICTIGDVSGDERKSIKSSIRSAYLRVLR